MFSNKLFYFQEDHLDEESIRYIASSQLLSRLTEALANAKLSKQQKKKRAYPSDSALGSDNLNISINSADDNKSASIKLTSKISIFDDVDAYVPVGALTVPLKENAKPSTITQPPPFSTNHTSSSAASKVSQSPNTLPPGHNYFSNLRAVKPSSAENDGEMSGGAEV